MHSRGYVRDKFAYSITIELYARKGHIEMGEDGFQGTVKYGSQPNIVDYGSTLNAYVALPLDLQSFDLACSVACLFDRTEHCVNEKVQNWQDTAGGK